MKIKTDFITNSSSASYIIAIRKGLTVDDVKNELLKDKENLKNYLDEYKSYWEEYDNDEYDDGIGTILKTKTISKQINILAKALAKEIDNEDMLENSLEIGDFIAYACEGGSEDMDLFSNWLYSFGNNIDTENLKIKGFN